MITIKVLKTNSILMSKWKGKQQYSTTINHHDDREHLEEFSSNIFPLPPVKEYLSLYDGEDCCNVACGNVDLHSVKPLRKFEAYLPCPK